MILLLFSPFFQHLTDRLMNDQFGKVIHFGAVTIDQHQMGTAEIAQQTSSEVPPTMSRSAFAI